MSLGDTKHKLESSIDKYRETIGFSMHGSDSLRKGQSALAGAQYMAAAQEFSTASGLFAQGAEQASEAHTALGQGLGDLYPDTLGRSFAAIDRVSGYGNTAERLASDARTLAHLPPQVAIAEAGACMGLVGVTIESIGESAAALGSLVQSVEIIYDGI